jgi:hypothetical protein
MSTGDHGHFAWRSTRPDELGEMGESERTWKDRGEDKPFGGAGQRFFTGWPAVGATWGNWEKHDERAI